MHVLVHEDILKENFICNLDKCKGACCVHGDSGAPLNADELDQLSEVYPKVKHLMTEKGIAQVEKQGAYVIDEDGDYTTTCVNGNQECAYVIFENGITKCSIEKAYEQNLVSWNKPISCYLYPIRITSYPEFDALYYDRWHICSDACALGNQQKVAVYQFLEKPLIMKYGKEWYDELCEVAIAWKAEQQG